MDKWVKKFNGLNTPTDNSQKLPVTTVAILVHWSGAGCCVVSWDEGGYWIGHAVPNGAGTYLQYLSGSYGTLEEAQGYIPPGFVMSDDTENYVELP